MGHNSDSGEASATETVSVDYSKAEACDKVDPEKNSDSITSEKQHICHYVGCNKQFNRPYRLAAHLCVHRGELPFECSFEGCEKAYNTASHLKRHVINTHQQSSHETYYRCPFPGCDIKMRSQWNIKKHYKSKHETKSYECTHCTESFKKHSQLKAHMYEHTGVPPIHCLVCNAGFLRAGDLNRHMKHHKSHTCGTEGCGQVFETWTQLRKHLALEHPKEFICAHCNKIFHSKARLQSHVMAHTDKTEREVIHCPYNNCGRFYFEKKNLDHHIRSSHSGKVFPCLHPGCGRELRSQILWPTT